jgi:hypothetical protein
MDEIVLRAIAKWPNVPSVYSWLALDRRGNWLVKGERITNPAIVQFIGRNYERDDAGRWYFQNGPQRVFVDLDYTPLVYRLQPQAAGRIAVNAHTGVSAGDVRAAWIDERCDILLQTNLGIGVVVDRDLPLLAERLQQRSGEAPGDAVLEQLAAGGASGDVEDLTLGLDERRVALVRIRSDEVAAHFGFDPKPRPAPGEPEC